MKYLTLALIKIYQSLYWIKYQLILSAFGYVSTCKHTPSCSEYALKHVKEHGTILGLWQSLLRLLTCW